MNLFLDANVLVSVLNKEYPVFTFSARILSYLPHLFALPLHFIFQVKKAAISLRGTK
jgi:hypothetical protein